VADAVQERLRVHSLGTQLAGIVLYFVDEERAQLAAQQNERFVLTHERALYLRSEAVVEL